MTVGVGNMPIQMWIIINNIYLRWIKKSYHNNPSCFGLLYDRLKSGYDIMWPLNWFCWEDFNGIAEDSLFIIIYLCFKIPYNVWRTNPKEGQRKNNLKLHICRQRQTWLQRWETWLGSASELSWCYMLVLVLYTYIRTWGSAPQQSFNSHHYRPPVFAAPVLRPYGSVITEDMP